MSHVVAAVVRLLLARMRPTARYSFACSGLALVGATPLEETTRVRTMLGLNAPHNPSQCDENDRFREARAKRHWLPG